jgi:hypothetical protein
MNGVDTGDQLRGHKDETRRRRRGGWQAIDGFLLLTVLTNSYLIALHADYEGKLKMRSQDSFRRDIITGLFRIGSYAKVPSVRAGKPSSGYVRSIIACLDALTGVRFVALSLSLSKHVHLRHLPKARDVCYHVMCRRHY